MSESIKIGIMGGAGYTGGELLRILLWHPKAIISFVHSASNAGASVTHVHTDLIGDTDLVFTAAIDLNIDVLFLCLAHGEASRFLASNEIPQSIKIIDLSQDFRTSHLDTNSGRKFVYGLPEMQKAIIQSAQNIANPGCFATAIQLGLLPLAKEGILGEIHTTGITGSTGAGQSLTPTSHFSWRANNVQAYKTLAHQHLPEIIQTLHQLQGNQEPAVYFVPWRGGFTRGLFVTSLIDTNLSIDQLHELYTQFYKGHSFTYLSKNNIDLKQVVNTNKCLIHLEKNGNKLAIHTVIDNLLKGAVGQAVQNMNLLFGFTETAGLLLKANYF